MNATISINVSGKDGAGARTIAQEIINHLTALGIDCGNAELPLVPAALQNRNIAAVAASGVAARVMFVSVTDPGAIMDYCHAYCKGKTFIDWDALAVEVNKVFNTNETAKDLFNKYCICYEAD